MSSYLITGATGYIGSMLVKYILYLDPYAKITAVVRNTEKAGQRLPQEITIVQADLADKISLNNINMDFDYILHCASVTKSSEIIAHPVEVIESIVNSTQNILEMARRCGVKSMVYVSSMEIYGDLDCSDGHKATEQEAGSGLVDILNVRSCYPLGKQMAENICYSYYKEYGVPVKIARLAQTFGRGILQEDSRVFIQIAKSVKVGKEIVLHTTGESMGNYCSIDDVMTGIITILEDGVNGEAYNIVNENNTMTIRQMAELVAEKIAERKIGIVYDIPVGNIYGYAANTRLRLSGSKLIDLGWRPTKTLETMYEEMLEEIE